eukprot:3268211-Prymnesium_polylepis.1
MPSLLVAPKEPSVANTAVANTAVGRAGAACAHVERAWCCALCEQAVFSGLWCTARARGLLAVSSRVGDAQVGSRPVGDA